MPKEDNVAGKVEQVDDDTSESDPTVQTLTDLFDQLDRAAFKRVLDYRDSIATSRKKPAGNG